VRAILELSGIRDVLAKSMGSKSAVNVTKATLQALQTLRSREQALAIRQ
jgi:small subunit ribosomal protein S5